MIIDDLMANRFVTELSTRSGIALMEFNCEIQDDLQLLLVTVAAASIQTEQDRRKFLKLAQELAGRVIPGDEGRYTWMVSVVENQQVVDAVFGGDRLNPLAGYI